MIYEVTVDGKAHRVELHRSKEGWLCKLDGVDLPLDAISTREGVLSILIGAESYEVKRESTAAEHNIVVRGIRFPVQLRDPRALRSRRLGEAAADGPKKIVAPMPGKVVRILAPVGTAVEHGQGVIVIEAMKMQNELKSPKKGTVSKLNTAEGAAVEAGQALAEVD